MLSQRTPGYTYSPSGAVYRGGAQDAAGILYPVHREGAPEGRSLLGSIPEGSLPKGNAVEGGATAPLSSPAQEAPFRPVHEAAGSIAFNAAEDDVESPIISTCHGLYDWIVCPAASGVAWTARAVANKVVTPLYNVTTNHVAPAVLAADHVSYNKVLAVDDEIGTTNREDLRESHETDDRPPDGFVEILQDQCVFCHSHLALYEKFCDQCSRQRLSVLAEERCHRCAHLYLPEAQFCTKCGHPRLSKYVGISAKR